MKDASIITGGVRKIAASAGVNLSPQPNNGMHPTADTLPVIYFQRLGAAGDAGR